MIKQACVLVLLALLSACMSSPDWYKPGLEDFGPVPRDHESIVKTYYRSMLVKPDSITFARIGPPVAIWLGERSSGPSYGYAVCVEFSVQDAAGQTVQAKEALVVHADLVTLRVPKGEWFARKLC